MDVINFILNFWVELGAWFGGVLAGWGLPPWAVNLIADFLGVVILLVCGVMAVLVFTPMERKVIARMQDRPGPNRVWPYGLLQALADAIKDDGRFSYPGFGTFKVKERAARKGRNPRTGQTISIGRR